MAEDPTQLVSVPEYVTGQDLATSEHLASFIDMALVPEAGVGVHVAGGFKPFYVPFYKELIIGRPTDVTLEATLDLSDLNAVNLGVSRRHAMIRRTATGYEAIDLASRNGTWLNAERLIANKPYPFASGSQLRLGQMRLLIMYHPVKN
jgi:hypothetical protein